MDETVRLSWLSHKTALAHFIPTFRQNNTYCDVTICCNGLYFPAHRLILSTFSEYFKEILELAPCRHPFIIIQDVEVEDLKDLLDFIYVGETSIANKRMDSFFNAARNLKIKGLDVSNQAFDTHLPSPHLPENKNIHLSLGSPDCKISDTKNNFEAFDEPLDENFDSNMKDIVGEPLIPLKNSRNTGNPLIGSGNADSLISSENIENLLTGSGNAENPMDIKNIKNLPENTDFIQNIFESPESYQDSLEQSDIETVSCDDEFNTPSENCPFKEVRIVIEKCPEAIKQLKNSKFKKTLKRDASSKIRKTSKTGLSYDKTETTADEGGTFDTLNDNLIEINDILHPNASSQEENDEEGNPLLTNFCSAELSFPSCSEPLTSDEGISYFNEAMQENFQLPFIKQEIEENLESGSTPTEVMNEFSSENVGVLASVANQNMFEKGKSKIKRLRRAMTKGNPEPGKQLCCRFCPYKASRSQYLIVHLRTHTGEKPFQCPFCSYKSAQKSALNTHKQVHINKKAPM